MPPPTDRAIAAGPDDHGAVPAPCRGARGMLVLTLLIVLLTILFVIGDRLTTGPHPEDRAGGWISHFHLSGPALWPAGTPARHPETGHPGVDPRCCAGLEGRR